MAQQPINKIGRVSFIKGMNKDMDKSLFPSEAYLDARNFRLVTDEDATTGALENIKGTETFTDYIPEGYRVCGYTHVRDKVIVFVTKAIAAMYGYLVNPDSAIYQIDFADQYATGGVIADKEPTVTLLYQDSALKGRLYFDSSNKIIAVGRYENEDVQKIYWVDGSNKLRWCNIADTDLNNQYIDQFEVLPDVKLFTPSSIRPSGGSLKAGVVSYSYQFFTENGSETLFATASEPIQVSSSNENAANSRQYKGSEKYDDTGMGFSMTITNNNIAFTQVRGVAIHWDTLNGVPTIRIFAEQEIDPAASEFFLIDTGLELGELLYEDFAIVDTTLFSASALDTKDDILFAGDIVEEEFDIGTYDSRAYRFKATAFQTQSRIYDSWTNQPTSWINDRHLQSNTVGSTIEAVTWYEYVGNTYTGNTYSTAEIPDDFDCINLYNNYDEDRTDNADLEHNFEAKYMHDGVTLGGEGINIEYSFNDIPYTVTTGPSDWSALVINNSGTTDHWYGSNFASYFTAHPYPGYRSYANPMVAQKWKGYMRGETYRFGIIFFDRKGRRSTVQWVGDIRMPGAKRDHRNLFAEYVATLAYPLRVDFNVKSMPANAVSYQIVRCPRQTINDRNILAQGLLVPCIIREGVHYHANYIDAADSNRKYNFDPAPGVGTALQSVAYDSFGWQITKVAYLISPEINFNQNLTYSAGDKLVHIGEWPTTGRYTNNHWGTGSYDQRHTIRAVDWEPASSYLNSQNYINDAEVTSVIEGTFNVGGSSFNPYRGWTSGGTHYVDPNDSFKGTALAVEIDDSETWTPWSFTVYKPLVNYIRNNWLSIYGGNSFEGRASSRYIPAGTVRDSIGAFDVWGGDTFIDMFEHNNVIWDLTITAEDESMSEVIQIPVETSIDLSLRHDDHPSKVGERPNVQLMQEIKGLHEDSQTPTPDSYNQETDLYQYNSVYTQDNHSEYFYPDVTGNISLENTYDVRVKHSSKKINGETTDSWLKFAVNDYIDVDSTYGKINSLLNFKNQLLFWQNEAFGVLSINQRSLVSDNNPGALQLGTGGVLDRFDYLSTTIGNTNKWGLVQTESSLYWLDNRLKEIYAYVGKTMPITAIKGVKSYFNSFNNIGDAVTVNDRKFDEVLFTIQPTIETTINNRDLWLGLYSYVALIDADDIGSLTTPQWVWIDDIAIPIISVVEQGGGTYYELYWLSGHDMWDGKEADDIIHISSFSDRDTLVLSERVGAFTGFYDFHPHMYIDARTPNFYSVNDFDEKKIHQHNIGDYGKFYGGQPEDSTVKVMFNQEYPVVKVFDNMSFPTTSATGTSQVFEDNFYTMRCYNDYQNTGFNAFDWWFSGSHELERRERIWSTYIARSKINKTMDTIYDVLDNSNLMLSGNNTERIRDSYMITDLKYSNINNYRFNVPQLTCEYRISKR